MKNSFNLKYDIVIVGGGTSGCAAAYNSAKLGFKTLLVEKNNFLGGLMTAGLVVPVMKSSLDETNSDYYKVLVSKMKEYITENIEEGEHKYIETDKVAEKIFDGKPGMREEFIEKIEKANVPQRVEVNSYVTKKLSSNVKIVTDIGVEVIFPAEYYQDSEYVQFINNEDGTISIQINNIGEVINK